MTKLKPPDGQLSLLDPVEAHAATEDGIARARRLVSENQRQMLEDAVWVVAKMKPFLRADHVWDWLGIKSPGPRLGSALGPVMRDCAHLDRWIELVDFKPSERGCMHRKRQAVWKSLIYDPLFIPPEKPKPYAR